MENQKVIFCRECGHKNDENNHRCTACNALLHASPRPAVTSDDGTMGGLVPYKNSKALWAYYLGVFSIIPFLGIPLGIAAVILGFAGLSYANANPESKGKAHALVGILAGGSFTLLYLFLVLVILNS